LLAAQHGEDARGPQQAADHDEARLAVDDTPRDRRAGGDRVPLERGRIARAACGSITPVMRRMRREFPRPYDDSKLIADIRSVYDGRWDLIRYSDGREELFDVSTDPEERFNRVQLEPGVVFELQGLLPPFEPNTVKDEGK